VTRLVVRGRRARPTGIDRVALAYARWLRAQEDLDVIPVAVAAGRIARVRESLFHRLVQDAEAAAAAPLAGEAWGDLVRSLEAPAPARRALRATERSRSSEKLALSASYSRRYLQTRLLREPGGDIYLNVAHTGLESGDLLQRLRARGVKCIVMVHDIIPLTHPEFCAPGAAERHERRLAAALASASLILTNSLATSRDIEAYALGLGRCLPPVRVAPLGVEDGFRCSVADAFEAPPYFVSIGTIEARKNLAFLLTLWRGLAERLGEGAPRLVLVGRRGWENEGVIDHLERSASIRALVHEVSGLGDRQIARLIAGARALLAPSMAEGYDLPVAEALAVGTPVIASDIPAHRELAAGSRLLDPLDGPGWSAAIEAACARRQPARPAPAPTWDDHFKLVSQLLWRSGHD
jgi:glycosyltransferase involved in cell wall biosynthesis